MKLLFDKVGNRLTKTEGTNTTNYTYNSVNEMLTAGSDSYTYDQNGNTLTGGGRTYVWDQQNRLTQTDYVQKIITEMKTSAGPGAFERKLLAYTIEQTYWAFVEM